MFNNLFNSITFYIILGLSISTLGFGYLSYSLSNDKAVAVYALKESKETIAEYEKSLNLKYLSCEIDSGSVVEVEAEKKGLVIKTEDISKEINKLSSGLIPYGIKKPANNNIITEAPKNAEESHVLTGSELLSSDLRKLLLKSYCNVEPSDQQCLPSR